MNIFEHLPRLAEKKGWGRAGRGGADGIADSFDNIHVIRQFMICFSLSLSLHSHREVFLLRSATLDFRAKIADALD
jgi:hypothetical protein